MNNIDFSSPPIIDNLQVYASCMCAHNTAGIHCETCQAGFNNLPWKEGNESTANACEGGSVVIKQMQLSVDQPQ